MPIYKRFAASLQGNGAADPTVIVREDTIILAAATRLSAGEYYLDFTPNVPDANKWYVPPIGNWNGAANPAIPLWDGIDQVGWFTLYKSITEGMNVYCTDLLGNPTDIDTLIGTTAIDFPELQLYP